MEDIRLDADWQLTRAANGDAPIAKDNEEFLQSIRLESMTQEGDLFYDPDYGWSLLDFIQREDSDLTRLEIQERIRSKMSRRTEVDATTIRIAATFSDDILSIDIVFKRIDSNMEYGFRIDLDRIRVEVIE